MTDPQDKPLVVSMFAAQQNLLIVKIVTVCHILKQICKLLGKMGMDNFLVQPTLRKMFFIGFFSCQQHSPGMKMDAPGVLVELKHFFCTGIRQKNRMVHTGYDSVIALQTDHPIGVFGADARAAHHHLSKGRMFPGIFQLYHASGVHQLFYRLINVLAVPLFNASIPVAIAFCRRKDFFKAQDSPHGFIRKHLALSALGIQPNHPQPQIRIFQNVLVMQIQKLAQALFRLIVMETVIQKQ